VGRVGVGGEGGREGGGEEGQGGGGRTGGAECVDGNGEGGGFGLLRSMDAAFGVERGF